MKTRIVLSMTVAALFVGLAVATTAGLAERRYTPPVPYHYPVGSVHGCGKGCGGRINDMFAFTTQGTGSAVWTANSTAEETQPWSEFQINQFTAVGNTPELGDFSYTIDESRILTSRIQSNVVGQPFPATAIHTMHVFATIGGVQYRTITPITAQAVLQASDWPQRNVLYTQIGTTDLERVDQPGRVALTLTNVEARVNAIN